MLAVGAYKTRGGVDAVIVAVVDGVAYGYRVGEGPRAVTTWDANSGSYFIDGSEDSWDIIDTKPRIKREAWLTIYNDEVDGIVVGGGHSTKNAAQKNRGAKCIAIARIVIDCVEGENLD